MENTKKTSTFEMNLSLIFGISTVLFSLSFIYVQLKMSQGNIISITSGLISIIIYLFLIYFIVYSFIKVFRNKIKTNKDLFSINFGELYDVNEKDRLNSANLLLQNKYDEIINSYAFITNLAKNSIGFGFLGTLAGLVLAMFELTTIKDTNASNMINSLTNSLSGLFIAFFTSIAGILSNISLGMLYSWIQKILAGSYLDYEKKLPTLFTGYFPDNKSSEKLFMGKLIKKFELEDTNKIIPIKQDLESLAIPIKNAVDSLSIKIVETLNRKFKESIDSFTKSVNEFPTKVTENFTQSVNNINAKIGDLVTQHTAAMTKTKEEVEHQIKTVIEYRKKYEEDLKSGTDKRMKEINDSIKANFTTIFETYNNQLNTLEGISKKIESLHEYLDGFPEKISSEIIKFNTEITTQTQSYIANMKETLTGTNSEMQKTLISTSKENIKTYNTELIACIKPLKTNIDDLVTTLNTFGTNAQAKLLNSGEELLTPIKETISNLNIDFSSLSSEIKDYVKNFIEINEIVGENIKTNSDSNNSIIEFNKAIKEFSEEHQNQIKEMKSSSEYLKIIGDSIEKLSNYVDLRQKNEK